MSIRFENGFPVISSKIHEMVEGIKRQAAGRALEVANELRNNEIQVLSGQRSGRRYRIPGSMTGKNAKGKKRLGRYYVASAPGEPPAVRTGALRSQWARQVVEQPLSDGVILLPQISSSIRISNGQLLAELMDVGSRGGKILPRPFKKRVLEKTMPAARRIVRRPYTIK